MADSADLMVVGAYFGSGNKVRAFRDRIMQTYATHTHILTMHAHLHITHART